MGCGAPFGVQLANGSAQQVIGRLDCYQRFTMPIGDSTWPVAVLGSYGSCVGGEASAGVPPCLPGGGPPPLPSGTYAATAIVPDGVPAADPVEIDIR